MPCAYLNGSLGPFVKTQMRKMRLWANFLFLFRTTLYKTNSVCYKILDIRLIWYDINSIMIKLSKMTDYGVVIMSEMARMPDRTMTAPDVSLHTGLPVPTAAKILRILAKSPFLNSQRGAHGGYSLIRKPADISIAEIVRAMEGPVAVTSCVDDSVDDCSVQSCCPMRGGWEKINRALNTALEEVTLADMCHDTLNIYTNQRLGDAEAPSSHLQAE